MADPGSSLTPEKRLLKLIEEPQSEATQKGGPGFQLKSLLSVAALKGRLAYAKEYGLSFVKQKKESISLKQIGATAKIGTVGLGLYLGVNLMWEVNALHQDYKTGFDISQKEMVDLPVSEGRVFDPAFFHEVERRNIFLPNSKRVEAQNAETNSMSLKLVEFTKDLKLTGISVNPENPERTFCMIEDIKKNTTTFLKVGDTISGLEVKSIKSDGVVLRHEKEEIEIR